MSLRALLFVTVLVALASVTDGTIAKVLSSSSSSPRALSSSSQWSSSIPASSSDQAPSSGPASSSGQAVSSSDQTTFSSSQDQSSFSSSQDQSTFTSTQDTSATPSSSAFPGLSSSSGQASAASSTASYFTGLSSSSYFPASSSASPSSSSVGVALTIASPAGNGSVPYVVSLPMASSNLPSTDYPSFSLSGVTVSYTGPSVNSTYQLYPVLTSLGSPLGNYSAAFNAPYSPSTIAALNADIAAVTFTQQRFVASNWAAAPYRLFTLTVYIIDASTAVNGTTPILSLVTLEVDAVVTPTAEFVFSVDYADNYTGVAVTASQTTLLGATYQVTEYPTANANDTVTLTLTIEAGTLSRTTFYGTVAQVNAALAVTNYTAPWSYAPSATYVAGDPHYIGGDVWNTSVVLVTATLTSANASNPPTQWIAPVYVRLVNAAPTITVTYPAALTGVIAVFPTTASIALPIPQAGLVFGDADSYNSTEVISVSSALGATLCRTADKGTTDCSVGAISGLATIADLNAQGNASWSYLPSSTLISGYAVNDTITVTLYDQGHSGAIALSATVNFTVQLFPQPSVPAVTVAPVNVGQVNSTALTVTFPKSVDVSPVNPPIAYYLVRYFAGKDAVIVNVTANASLAAYTVYITGLTPATLYYAQVAVGNAKGTTAWSSLPAVNLTAATTPYPILPSTCGTNQYCGAQWTRPVAPLAPVLAFTSDVSLTTVSITQSAATNVTCDTFTVSYALLTGNAYGAFTTQTVLASPTGGAVTASLVGLTPSATYDVVATCYSTYFNIYSGATNVTLVTLALPPAITAFTVADPNGTATAANFNQFRAGLVFTLTFATAIQVPATTVNRWAFTFSAHVGDLTDFTVTSPTTISATVTSAPSDPTAVQLGVLTVTPKAWGNITAAAYASYPVETVSPKLTGTFGVYNFGVTALSVTAMPTVSNAADVHMSSLVSFTGTGTNYSYTVTVIAPASAYFTSNTSATPLTTFTYSAIASYGANATAGNATAPAIVGGGLTDVINSIDALQFNIPPYFSGQASYRVDALTWINGTFRLTSTAVGQVTVLPVYHAPVIVGQVNATIAVTSNQGNSTWLSLASVFPGLGLYDVDADPSVNPFADTTSRYSFTVTWTTASAGSYLALSGYNASVITNPDYATISALQSSNSGFLTLTAYGAMPALQAMIAQLALTSFTFDPTLTPSVLTVTVTSPQLTATTLNFTAWQNISTVPTADINGAYLIPSMTAVVLILDSQVTTALATSGAKFSPALLFNSTAAFGTGAACQYLPSNPVAAYLTATRVIVSAIQCSFGIGATFKLDPTNNQQLIPMVSLLPSSTVLQRVPGGQLTTSNVVGGNIALLPSATAYATPSFSLSGSTSLSFCDNQTLSISALVQSAGVGYGTTYAWVASDSTVTAALYTAGLTTSGALVIPHIEQYFVRGASYVLSLTVTNLVGRYSSQSITVTRQSSPAPILLGSSVQSNAITDLILLSFTPQLPGSCFSASSAIVYTWTAVNNTVTLDTTTTASSTLGFVRPYLSNGLAYGQSYTFLLTASLAGVNASTVSRAITLTIADKPLVVGIAGPSIFRSGAGSPLVLTTAGATQLPTQGKVVTYYWSCATAAGVACVAMDGVTPVPSVPSQTPLVVPANSLAASSTPYTFTVAVAVDGAPAQSASVAVYLVAGTPIQINVTAILGAVGVTGAVLVNDYNKLTLTATSSAGVNASYTWSCVACPATFTLNPNTSQASTLVLNPAATAAYWTPLASYQFRVDVVPADVSAASFSSIVVAVNTPPTPPTTQALVITGPSGVVGATLAGHANGVDQWTLSVAQTATGQSGWTGSGTLTYQFFFIDTTGAVNFLSSATTALAVTTALPLGSGVNGALPVGVVVYDSNGGQTVVNTTSLAITAPQVTLQADVSAAQLLGNLLNSSANLSPSAFMGAIVSLASAATAIGNASAGGAPVDPAVAQQQRAQLLSLISNNLNSVSPALGLQAVGSVVGGGAVSDTASLRQAATLISGFLTNALLTTSFSASPAQLASFFNVIASLMFGNTATSATTSRRLLTVTSNTARIATQDQSTAVFSQALRAVSSNFLGSAPAPNSQIVPPTTAAPAVYRAGTTQGVVAPFTVTLNGITGTLTAGANWVQSNAYTASAFDIQVGLVSPDPYPSLLVNVTNSTTFAGYTYYFDVVDTVTGASQSTFTWTNATGAPAVAFNVNQSAPIAAITRALTYQCVEWTDAAGYSAIQTVGPDSTGALTCYPTFPGSWVSYSASVVQLEIVVPVSSSTGLSGEYEQYAFLFSGYTGSDSMGGYYFWMAVSIALCLLFPVFVLTYRPGQAYPQSGKSAAAGPTDVEAQPAPAQLGEVYVSGGDGPVNRSARTSTVDAGTLDFVDVNKLKSNVYQQEEKKQESEGSDEAATQNDDVGFVVHQ